MITPSSPATPLAASTMVAPKMPVHLDTKRRLRVSQAQRRDILDALTAVSVPTRVAENKTPDRATTAVRPGRQPLPAHLETERVVLEPAEVPQQPAAWRKLGEEVTEELDGKPSKFIKGLYLRPKYASADRIIIAPLSARCIEKGLPGAGLLTQVIIGKYEDHLPPYQKEKICRKLSD